MIIRKETPADVDAISAITKAAFKDHPFSRNTEQFIIRALRAAGALTVSLVAEADGELLGHIAFSPVSFSDGSEHWYGLGPVSVRPDRQKHGIGTRLVHEGLKALKDLGAAGCILVGDLGFYARFGFTSPQGLTHEGVPPENLLALSFGDQTPTGTVEFHKAFAVTE